MFFGSYDIKGKQCLRILKRENVLFFFKVKKKQQQKNSHSGLTTRSLVGRWHFHLTGIPSLDYFWNTYLSSNFFKFFTKLLRRIRFKENKTEDINTLNSMN